MDTVYEFAHLISLNFALQGMGMAALIVVLFFNEAVVSFFQAFREELQWISMGIFISFVSKFLDQGYWEIAWSAEYLDHWTADYWMENGVFPNIPFRNILGYLAGYCHARAMAVKGILLDVRFLHRYMAWLFVAAALFTSILWLIKRL